MDKSQKILIEPATEADRKAIVDGIADLQDVEREISNTRRPGKEIAEQYVAQLEASIDQKRGAILVARVDGNVAGFIACWIEQEDTSPKRRNQRPTATSPTHGLPLICGVAECFSC